MRARALFAAGFLTLILAGCGEQAQEGRQGSPEQGSPPSSTDALLRSVVRLCSFCATGGGAGTSQGGGCDVRHQPASTLF